MNKRERIKEVSL